MLDQGLFSTFSLGEEKCECRRESECESAWALELAFEAEEAAKRMEETLRHAEEALERDRGMDQQQEEEEKRGRSAFLVPLHFLVMCLGLVFVFCSSVLTPRLLVITLLHRQRLTLLAPAVCRISRPSRRLHWW